VFSKCKHFDGRSIALNPMFSYKKLTTNQQRKTQMKRLLLGLITITSFSAIAGISDFAIKREVRKCSTELIKSFSDDGIKKDLRYLYHLDSYPLIHVFAVYEDQKPEALNVVKMVKLPGQKCLRY
jgi:hypothetical protein